MDYQWGHHLAHEFLASINKNDIIIIINIFTIITTTTICPCSLPQAGFFQRKEMEEMKAQQASVEPSSHYGTANTGLMSH